MALSFYTVLVYVLFNFILLSDSATARVITCIKYFYLCLFTIYRLYKQIFISVSFAACTVCILYTRKLCNALCIRQSLHNAYSYCVCDIITFQFWRTLYMSFQTLSVQYESPQNYVIYVFYIAHRSIPCTGKA